MSAQAFSEVPHRTYDGQMKVLIVVGEFPPQLGGIPDYAALLARELTVLGLHVTVLTTKVRDQEDRSVRQGVEIRRVMSEWGLSEIRSILKIIDEMGPGTVVNLMYGCFATRQTANGELAPTLLTVAQTTLPCDCNSS